MCLYIQLLWWLQYSINEYHNMWHAMFCIHWISASLVFFGDATQENYTGFRGGVGIIVELLLSGMWDEVDSLLWIATIWSALTLSSTPNRNYLFG